MLFWDIMPYHRSFPQEVGSTLALFLIFPQRGTIFLLRFLNFHLDSDCRLEYLMLKQNQTCAKHKSISQNSKEAIVASCTSRKKDKMSMRFLMFIRIISRKGITISEMQIPSQQMSFRSHFVW